MKFSRPQWSRWERSRWSRQLRVAGCVALIGWSSCTTTNMPPDLGGLYDELAQGSDLHRNPVIVIPGVLGSTLTQTGSGRSVWGAFTGDYANPQTDEGVRLISLPMAMGTPLFELVDDVYASGALDRLQLSFFGLPVGVAAYVNLLLALGAGGYRDETLAYSGAVDYGSDHFTCFQFAYDWRRDLSENAERLHAFVIEKKAFVEEQYRERFGLENPDVRFDIVAHSMGGLLGRYFLRYGGARLPEDGSAPELDWSGAELVEKLIVVAPPNSGSADALLNMLYGMDLGFFLPRYEAAVLGTMPGIYQLLPRPELGAVVSGDDFSRAELRALDSDYWIEKGWGLANPEQDDVLKRLMPGVVDPAERRRLALDHLDKCLARARQFFAAMDRPAQTPDGVEIILAAGDAQETPAVLAVDERGSDVWTVESGPGDGTVTRVSALGDRRSLVASEEDRKRLDSFVDWHRVMFFFEGHLELTRDPAFIDNLLFILLEEPRD